MKLLSKLLFNSILEPCIKQNTAVEIYEQYFPINDNVPSDIENEDDSGDEEVEESYARTISVFRPPKMNHQSVSRMSWCQDDPGKLAVAYCNFHFMSAMPREPVSSYVWDIEVPIHPKVKVDPVSPLVCLEYCPKDFNILLGGCYNGQIVLWDQRKGPIPAESTPPEQSHTDPVYGALWLYSKGTSECFSTSTDGQVIWWDIRNMTEPIETLILDPQRGSDHIPSLDHALGGTCLEFEPTMPTRFMVGTEEGVILACNRKAKGQAGEKITCIYNNGHFGPIYSLQRNPLVSKTFLTCGDFTSKIWSEEVRDSSIFTFRSPNSHVSDSCWISSRPSALISVMDSGRLEFWDFLFNQDKPLLVTQLCDDRLTNVKVQEQGHQRCHQVACGSKNGTVYLMELSKDLIKPLRRGEKERLTELIERETQREKIVESRRRELRLKELTQEEK